MEFYWPTSKTLDLDQSAMHVYQIEYLGFAFVTPSQLASVDINQRNHRAINSVVRCAISPDTERLLAALQVLHFPLKNVPRLDHVTQNI